MRLRAERQELAAKLEKLEKFLKDEKNLENISNKEISLLISQSYAMSQYLDILDMRLTYVKD
jgi:hypothetical protein